MASGNLPPFVIRSITTLLVPSLRKVRKCETALAGGEQTSENRKNFESLHPNEYRDRIFSSPPLTKQQVGAPKTFLR